MQKVSLVQHIEAVGGGDDSLPFAYISSSATSLQAIADEANQYRKQNNLEVVFVSAANTTFIVDANGIAVYGEGSDPIAALIANLPKNSATYPIAIADTKKTDL